MKKLIELYSRLNSVSVYRGLLENNILKSLGELLLSGAEYDEANPSRFMKAWGCFFNALCSSSAEENLCGSITELALYDDNIFSRSAASGREISPYLKAAVGRDLRILIECASLSPENILSMVNAAPVLVNDLPCWNTGEPVEQVRGDISDCTEKLMEFYKSHGCGEFVKHRAFIWRDKNILPVEHPDNISLTSLKGYDYPRNIVINNTVSFLKGLPANNCLLYGDRGTGKSSTVKAIMNEYYGSGLRIIEIPKENLMEFPYLVDKIADLPLKFIIFIDDLSFTKQDETYASLKAVLEGGVAARPKNTLIYATSNRRHLLRETFSDREGDEIHRSDTIEESLSLADRFGLSVSFSHPEKSEYLKLIRAMAEDRGLTEHIPDLEKQAEAWAIARGGRSPRTAVQFINDAAAKYCEGATDL